MDDKKRRGRMSKWNILATDYDSYAITYSCKEEWSWFWQQYYRMEAVSVYSKSGVNKGDENAPQLENFQFKIEKALDRALPSYEFDEENIKYR